MSGFIQPILAHVEEPFDNTAYPIVDFDAADYQTGPTTGVVPADGSMCNGSGGYSLQVVNPTSVAFPTPQITWSLTTSPVTGAQNPVFNMVSRRTWSPPVTQYPPVGQTVNAWISINDVNFGSTLYGVPFGVRPYSVFVAYRTGINGSNLVPHNQGRLFSTNAKNDVPMVQPVTNVMTNQLSVYRDWWIGTEWNGVYTETGNYNQRINGIFPATFVTNGSADNGLWQFLWVTYSGAYNYYGGFTMYGFYADNAYGFENVVPSNNTRIWPAANWQGYFNSPLGIRLWSRYLNATTGYYVQDAEIGFVKVYDKALTLQDMEKQYNTYKTRFGMTRPWSVPFMAPYPSNYPYQY
jgi:hypothetical protein